MINKDGGDTTVIYEGAHVAHGESPSPPTRETLENDRTFS